MDAISVFVKVVEAGNFSLAARRLGMPKTTVSAKVAGLERRLGVRLIQRTTSLIVRSPFARLNSARLRCIQRRGNRTAPSR